jgi:hypothetical protein
MTVLALAVTGRGLVDPSEPVIRAVKWMPCACSLLLESSVA